MAYLWDAVSQRTASVEKGAGMMRFSLVSASYGTVIDESLRRLRISSLWSLCQPFPART